MSNFDFIATYVDLSDVPTYTTNITLEGQLLKISFVWNERIGKRTIFIRNSADICYLQNTILHPNESFELNSNAIFDDLPYKVVLQKVGDTNKVGNIYNWSKDFILCFYRTVDIETERLNIKYGVNAPSTPITPKPFSAPYNLTVEFKNDETNRLELNWSLDGLVDEQRYYCSEIPIDPDNLPEPKAILDAMVRSYMDTDVLENQTYYIRIGSIKNGNEKLSDESQVNTLAINYTAKYPLIIDAKDVITNEQFTLFNSSISNDGVYFNGESSSYATKSDTPATTLGNADFTIEFLFKSDRAYGSNEVLIDNYDGSGMSWQIMLDSNGRATMFNSGYAFRSNKSYLDGMEHHYVIVKKNGISKAIIDGEIVATFELSSDLPTKSNFSMGIQFSNKTYPYKGWIRDLKICHEALYGF